ncbi:transposase [Bacillus cereus]|uniref:Transposase n=1 Tax=Bacillus cereus TaxID=1396 RepID=A0A1C4CPC9_BACCE|nr:transposase [Bacillus cereus]OKA40501.1 transposase [Bacillus cereus]SCC20977.1 Uncharacterized protein BC0861_02675 [Bacillus mobilis]
MVKFSQEQKLEVVRQYLDGSDGVKRLARSIKTHPSVIQQWVKQYKAVGEKAFEKRYTSYSLQYKLDVLNYMDKQGTSIRETAAIFNIPSYETVRRWKEAYDLNGVDSLITKKRGRPAMENKNIRPKLNHKVVKGSIEALQEENERLLMEIDYLKKLNALIQKKTALQNKTKQK